MQKQTINLAAGSLCLSIGWSPDKLTFGWSPDTLSIGLSPAKVYSLCLACAVLLASSGPEVSHASQSHPPF